MEQLFIKINILGKIFESNSCYVKINESYPENTLIKVNIQTKTFNETYKFKCYKKYFPIIIEENGDYFEYNILLDFSKKKYIKAIRLFGEGKIKPFIPLTPDESGVVPISPNDLKQYWLPDSLPLNLNKKKAIYKLHKYQKKVFLVNIFKFINSPQIFHWCIIVEIKIKNIKIFKQLTKALTISGIGVMHIDEQGGNYHYRIGDTKCPYYNIPFMLIYYNYNKEKQMVKILDKNLVNNIIDYYLIKKI